MSAETRPVGGRISTLAAAYVVARRDFLAILFSRSFIFFLLGPIFMFVVAAFSGGLGEQMRSAAYQPRLGVAMSGADVNALLAVQTPLTRELGDAIPTIVVLRKLSDNESFSAADALTNGKANSIGAVLTGTLANPVLTGSPDQLKQWEGPVRFMAAAAAHGLPTPMPKVSFNQTVSSGADQQQNQVFTAQLVQTVLFMLTMLLAGMVLSNLVEEKGNKIIEVLAAAVPMDAVFFGKLFAMLAVSFVGIAVWAAALGIFAFAAGGQPVSFPAPAVGWPILIVLGIIYFAMAYLLLGAVFLAIGSLAATVREVQTLSMPVTMLQLVVFFFASFAMTKPGSPAEIFSVVFPFSSPYAMLARAAQSPEIGEHVVAIGWQGFCVMMIVRLGAKQFRSRVMMSGPAGAKPSKGWLVRLRRSQT